MQMNTNSAGGQTTFQETFVFERGAIANKWGSALDAGFQVVPSVLIKAQSRLGLDAVDCMILLNLNLHWWKRDNLPYPPPALIARRMGVSRRTVERRLFRLQKAGWVKRLSADAMGGQPKVRKYDLSGMVERLQEAAIIAVNQREYRTRLNSKSKPPQTLPDGRNSTNQQSRDLIDRE
jgi:DnaD N-terminal domain